MRRWWRRWIWVPLRERWRFHVPITMAYANLLLQEHYADHIREQLNRPCLIMSRYFDADV